MQKKIFCWAISLAICFVATFINNACSAESVLKEPLKVAFILAGSRSDYGWNYAHDQGRIYLEKNMAGNVRTTVVENIPESAEVERVMEKLIAQGNKVIFATAYGYLEPTRRVAARHPDIVFMHAGFRVNTEPMKNVGTYFANIHQAIYLTGIVAGRMTKKNKIGYVGAHPVPPLLVNLNAFALGVHSVNPKAKIQMVWVNTWHDPILEAEAAQSLIDNGADVLFVNMDSAITAIQTAEKNQVYSIAPPVDLNYLAPNGWLVGAKWNWGPLYVKIVQSVLNHTWQATDARYDIKDGYVQLSSFGKAVPDTVRKEVLDDLKAIKENKLTVFKGPIKDQDGNLKVAAGQVPSITYLEKIDWIISGVNGAVPGDTNRKEKK